ncbi:unnamed protein product [Closterium sp. Naga37s-1]|nr:unnamed protein product [Closterium sp. Naga37s-1]CAI5499764.1 unnamed protein product [Closterium sp. Naga37s-1]
MAAIKDTNAIAEAVKGLFGLVRGELAAVKGELAAVREEVARQNERALMLEERNAVLGNEVNELRRALRVVGEKSAATAAVVEERGREYATAKGEVIGVRAKLAEVNGKLAAVQGEVTKVKGEVTAVRGEAAEHKQLTTLQLEEAERRRVEVLRGKVEERERELVAVRVELAEHKGAVAEQLGVAERRESNLRKLIEEARKREVEIIAELERERGEKRKVQEELAAYRNHLDVDREISQSAGHRKTAWEQERFSTEPTQEAATGAPGYAVSGGTAVSAPGYAGGGYVATATGPGFTCTAQEFPTAGGGATGVAAMGGGGTAGGDVGATGGGDTEMMGGDVGGDVGGESIGARGRAERAGGTEMMGGESIGARGSAEAPVGEGKLATGVGSKGGDVTTEKKEKKW